MAADALARQSAKTTTMQKMRRRNFMQKLYKKSKRKTKPLYIRKKNKNGKTKSNKLLSQY